MSSVHSTALSHRMFARNPRITVWKLEALERAGFDLRAVARVHRSEIAPAPYPHRVDEVFVEVVDELAGAVFQRAADRDEVEDREVLHVLAEPDTPGVRAHGNS